MILLLMLSLSSSGQKLLEYKFWKNYGKVIYDYSLNGRHAINGISLSDLSADVTFTDRGLYMENSKTITLPPNDLASSFILTDSATIMFWISMADQVGQIFVRYCTDYILGIHKHNQEHLHLWVFAGQSLLSQYPQTFLVCNFHIDKWVMVSYILTQKTLIVRINDYVHYNSSLVSKINLSSACSSMKIGSYIYDSINFFMWNFVIASGVNEYLNYFNSQVSSLCFIGACSCNPAMKLDDLGIGCASELTDMTKNSLGSACINSPCRGIYHIQCLCSSKSCSFDIDNTVYCIDYTANKFSSAVIDCRGGGQGCSVCLADCKTCTEALTCSSCVNSLAEVNSTLRCQCIDGYYSLDTVVIENSCLSCPKECLTCLSPTECTSCSFTNFILTQGKCKCIDGYFLHDPLKNNSYAFSSNNLECLNCLNECQTCADPSSCRTCKDANAILDKSCACQNNSFYWGRLVFIAILVATLKL